MAIDEDRRAEAIAADWGVTVRLLNDTFWELEEIAGNDGEIYGYRVIWEADADPDMLRQLGVAPGSFSREVSLNAFDEPDMESDRGIGTGTGTGAAFVGSAFAGDAFAINGSPLNDSPLNGSDDGIFSIDQPLPDISDFADDEEQDDPDEDEDLNQPSAREDYTKTVLTRKDNPPHGGASLIDENGSFLTDSAGDRLIVNGPSSAVSGSTVENLSFAPGSVSTFGNFTFGQSTYGQSANQASVGDTGSNGGGERSLEALHQEMLYRVDRLEALIRVQIEAPNRGHNHPPELLEVDRPATRAQLQEVLTAIAEIRSESSATSPSPQKIIAQASVFQRISALFRSGPGLVVSWAVGGIVGNRADDALKGHYHEIYTALVGAADAAILWAQHLAAHL